MANGKKINELTLTTPVGGQLIPVGYSSPNDTVNSITVQDIVNLIPSSGFIKQWNNTTNYNVGEVVYYSSATTKGIFEITAFTNAGETPESVNYTKFKSVSLSFIPNITASGNPLGYNRTGRFQFPLISTSGDPAVLLYSFFTSFSEADLMNARISANLSRHGQTTGFGLRMANVNTNNGDIIIVLETWGTLNNVSGLFLDFTIEL